MQSSTTNAQNGKSRNANQDLRVYICLQRGSSMLAVNLRRYPSYCSRLCRIRCSRRQIFAIGLMTSTRYERKIHSCAKLKLAEAAQVLGKILGVLVFALLMRSPRAGHFILRQLHSLGYSNLPRKRPPCVDRLVRKKNPWSNMGQMRDCVYASLFTAPNTLLL